MKCKLKGNSVNYEHQFIQGILFKQNNGLCYRLLLDLSRTLLLYLYQLIIICQSEYRLTKNNQMNYLKCLRIDVSEHSILLVHVQLNELHLNSLDYDF